MEKVINIGEKEVRLNNNVAWTMEYRDQFGKDILPVIMPLVAALSEGLSAVLADIDGEEITAQNIASALEGRSIDIMLPLFQAEFVDIVVNVTWAMAKAADESIMPPKQWARQFDSFPLDIIVPEVGSLVLKGFSSSKNLNRLKTLGESLKKLQPSPLTTSSSADSNED